MILPSLLPQIVNLEKISPQKARTKYGKSPTLLHWPPWGTWVTGSPFTWLHSLEAFPSPTNPSHSHTRPCSSSQPRCLGPPWYACLPESTGLGCGAGNQPCSASLPLSLLPHAAANLYSFSRASLLPPLLPTPSLEQVSHSKLPTEMPCCAASLTFLPSLLETSLTETVSISTPLALAHTLSKVLLSRRLLQQTLPDRGFSLTRHTSVICTDSSLWPSSR